MNQKQIDEIKALIAQANISLSKATQQLSVVAHIPTQTTYEEIVQMIDYADQQISVAKEILDFIQKDV